MNNPFKEAKLTDDEVLYVGLDGAGPVSMASAEQADCAEALGGTFQKDFYRDDSGNEYFYNADSGQSEEDWLKEKQQSGLNLTKAGENERASNYIYQHKMYDLSDGRRVFVREDEEEAFQKKAQSEGWTPKAVSTRRWNGVDFTGDLEQLLMLQQKYAKNGVFDDGTLMAMGASEEQVMQGKLSQQDKVNKILEQYKGQGEIGFIENEAKTRGLGSIGREAEGFFDALHMYGTEAADAVTLDSYWTLGEMASQLGGEDGLEKIKNFSARDWMRASLWGGLSVWEAATMSDEDLHARLKEIKEDQELWKYIQGVRGLTTGARIGSGVVDMAKAGIEFASASALTSAIVAASGGTAAAAAPYIGFALYAGGKAEDAYRDQTADRVFFNPVSGQMEKVADGRQGLEAAAYAAGGIAADYVIEKVGGKLAMKLLKPIAAPVKSVAKKAIGKNMATVMGIAPGVVTNSKTLGRIGGLAKRMGNAYNKLTVQPWGQVVKSGIENATLAGCVEELMEEGLQAVVEGRLNISGEVDLAKGEIAEGSWKAAGEGLIDLVKHAPEFAATLFLYNVGAGPASRGINTLVNAYGTEATMKHALRWSGHSAEEIKAMSREQLRDTFTREYMTGNAEVGEAVRQEMLDTHGTADGMMAELGRFGYPQNAVVTKSDSGEYTVTVGIGGAKIEIKGNSAVREWAAKELGKKAAKFGRGAFLAEKQMAAVSNAIMFLNRKEIHNVTRTLRETGAFDNFEVFGNSAESVEAMREALAFRYMAESRMYSGTPISFLFHAASQSMMNRIEKQSKENGDTLFKEFHRYSNGISLEGEKVSSADSKKLFTEDGLSNSGTVGDNGDITWSKNGVFISKDAQGHFSAKVETEAIKTATQVFSTAAEAVAYANELGAKKAAADARHEHWRKTAEEIYDKLYNGDGSANRNMLILHNAYENDKILDNVRGIYEKSQYADTMSFEHFLSLNTALRIPNGGIVIFTDNINSLTRLASAIRHEGMHTGLANLYNLDQDGKGATEFMNRVLPLFKQGGGKYILRDAGGHEITLKKYEAASDSDKAIILDEAMAYLCEMMTKEPELSDTIIDTVGKLFGSGDVNWKSLTARQRARETRALISEAFSRVHDPDRAVAMQSWHRGGTTNVRASTPTYGLRIAELIAKNAPKDDSLEAEAEAEAKVAAETPAAAVKAVEDYIAEHREDLNGHPVEEAEEDADGKTEEAKTEEKSEEAKPEEGKPEEPAKEEPKPFDLTPYLERKTKRQRDYEQRLAEKTIDLIGKGGEKLATFEAALLKELQKAQELLLALVPDGVITSKPKATVIELYQKIAALNEAIDVLEKNRIITENRDAEAKHKLQLEADTIYTIKDIIDNIRNNKDASSPLFENKDISVLKKAIEENLEAAQQAEDEYAVEVMQEALDLLSAKPAVVKNLIDNNIAEAARAFEEARRERQATIDNAMELVQYYVDEEFANIDEGFRLHLGTLKGFDSEEVKAIKSRSNKEVAREIVNSLYSFFESELEKQFASGELTDSNLWDSDNEYANALAYVRGYKTELEEYIENYIQLKKVEAFAATRKAQAESSESGEARLNEDLAAFETLGSATVDTFEKEVEQGVLNSPRAIAEYTALMRKKLSQSKKKLVEPKPLTNEKGEPVPTRQQRSEENRRKHEEANAKRQKELKSERKQREQERKQQEEEQKKIEAQNRLWRDIFRGLAAFGSAVGKKIEPEATPVATEEKSPTPVGKNVVAPVTPETVKKTKAKVDKATKSAQGLVEEKVEAVVALKDELGKFWKRTKTSNDRKKNLGELSEGETLLLLSDMLISEAFGDDYNTLSPAEASELLNKAGYDSESAAFAALIHLYGQWRTRPQFKKYLPKNLQRSTVPPQQLNAIGEKTAKKVSKLIEQTGMLSVEGELQLEKVMESIKSWRKNTGKFFYDLGIKIGNLSTKDAEGLIKVLGTVNSYGDQKGSENTSQDSNREVLEIFHNTPAALFGSGKANYDELSGSQKRIVEDLAKKILAVDKILHPDSNELPSTKNAWAAFKSTLVAGKYSTLLNTASRKHKSIKEGKSEATPGFSTEEINKEQEKFKEGFNGGKISLSGLNKFMAVSALMLMKADPRFTELKLGLDRIGMVVSEAHGVAYTKGNSSLRSREKDFGETAEQARDYENFSQANKSATSYEDEESEGEEGGDTGARAQIIGEFGATPEELVELEKAKKLMTKLLNNSAQFSTTQTEYDDLEDFRKDDPEGFTRFIHEAAPTLQKSFGWFIGFDGKWRLEVEDVRVLGDIPGLVDMFDSAHYDGTSETPRTIAEFLANRDSEDDAKPLADLVKRYPLLAEVEISLTPYLNDGRAGRAKRGVLGSSRKNWATPPQIEIRVPENDPQNSFLSAIKSEEFATYTLLHEIQHVIQQVEGFTGGSSPTSMVNFLEAMSNLKKGALRLDATDLKQLLETFGFTSLDEALAHYEWMKRSNDRFGKLLTKVERDGNYTPFNRRDLFDAAVYFYQNNYGEFEARGVEARAKERIANRLSGYGKSASKPFDTWLPRNGEHYPVSIPDPMHLFQQTGASKFSTSDRGVEADITWADGTTARAQVIGKEGATVGELKLLRKAIKMLDAEFAKSGYGSRFKNVQEFATAKRDKEDPAERVLWNKAFYRFLNAYHREDEDVRSLNEKLYHATGWYMGHDGFWRLEVPNVPRLTEIFEPVYLKALTMEKKYHDSVHDGKSFTFGEMSAEDKSGKLSSLIKRYPALENVRVEFKSSRVIGGSGTARPGEYNKATKSWYGDKPVILLDIDVILDEDEYSHVFAHEVQHVIQDIERFSTGGNPVGYSQVMTTGNDRGEEYLTPEQKRLYKFLMESNPGLMSVFTKRVGRGVRDAAADMPYFLTYGELEARAIEFRNGDESWLRDVSPSVSIDEEFQHTFSKGSHGARILELASSYADKEIPVTAVHYAPIVLDNTRDGRQKKSRQHYLAQMMSEDDVEMNAYNARVAEAADAIRSSEGLGSVGNAAYDRVINYLGPLLRAYRTITNGKQVADSENVEAAMKNVHGKIRTKADDLHRKYIKPLIEIIKDNDLDADRLDDYLYAKFAPERNKMIQARTLVVDPDTGDLITMDEDGSGMSAEESARLLKRLEGEKNRAAYLKAMHLVWAMNGEVAQMYVDYGIATKAQQETWRKLSPHYVPLKDLESPSFSLKKRSGALGGLLHRAKGRTTRAASPLAASIAQANGVITKGELSEANKTLARFVKKYDADGSRMGGRVAEFTGIARSIREGKAMFVPDGSNAEAIITEYNNLPEVKSSGQTVDLIVTEESAKLGGKIVSRADGIPEKLRVNLVKSKASAPNVVEYFEDGTRKFVVFDKNNAEAVSVAEAVNRSKLVTQSTAGSLQGAWSVAQRLTRWKADVSTSLNPRFILRNMGADFFNTAMIMMTEGKWGALGSFAKNYRKAVKSVRDFAKGKDVSKTDVGKYYMEARENGMLTGVFAEGSFKAAAHKLSRDLKRLKGNDLRKGWEAFKDFMETIGSYPEQGARLAAYIAVRESGMSPAQAAQYGREITVDFNAKGQWTPILNTLYMFSNAGAQGIARAAKALQVGAEARGGGMQGYVRAALPGILVSTALGFISAALMDMGGDDDDEDDVNTSKWARLPEHVKAGNLTVPFVGDTYIQLPTRGAWQAFTHFGGLLYDYASGTKDGADVVAGFTESVRDSVDFIGGNAPTGWQWLAPTIADPIVQVLEGKDWTGRDLYRRNYGQQQADSDQGKNSTGSIYKGIAKGLNYITGGDEVKGGLIDVYPETFKVFTEFMVGSLAQIALSDIPNTVQTVIGEREASASDIPVLGGVLRQSSGVDSLYYKHYNEYNEIAETVSAYRKRRKAAKTREEREEWLGKERKLIKEHPWAKSVDGLRKLTTRINELRTKIVNGAPNREQLEAQIEELQKRFIRFVQ